MIRLFTALSACLLLSACVIHVGPGSYRNPNVGEDTVFGDIQVPSGQTVGSLSSVNGSISVSFGAKAGHVSTVNGSIELDEKVEVDSITSVNGSINGGKDLRVQGEIETVNGTIRLAQNSSVLGEINSTNGDILLTGVKLQSNLITINGDITVKSDSVIAGNIVVKGNKGSDNNNNKPPVITLAQEVNLMGAILLERPATIKLSNPEHQAKVQRLYLK
ncbi:polymer-forming cytoskeletal protein [Planctobacterium marinum]|uniref:Polymer-forming cytoskeletal protein n=1 Tax=Planctobacterium marinum TaxID=1631968 RepID=A0AA48HM70_9ALTE|nr:hypothetical protein MACH26_28820 [Planctobacterium marinum]